jgi:hypothetical protein
MVYSGVYLQIYILEVVPMGKPLMLQDADAARIETLKERLGARTKIEVVRSALGLLERDADRIDRVARWQRAARMVATESRRVSREFRRHSRLRRLD